MLRILFLIPSWEPSGAATQLALLVRSLPRGEVEPRVCVLGPETGATPDLGGAANEYLGWRRAFDVRPWLRLRELIRRERPDVIHAWQFPALRAAVLASGLGRPRLIASGIRPRENGQAPDRLRAWFLHQADVVVATGEADRAFWEADGLPAGRLAVVPPGVDCPEKLPERDQALAHLGLPTDQRYVTALGPFEAHKGARDAVWALDILRYVYTDLHLLLVGEGASRTAAADLAQGLRQASQVHWLGQRGEVTSVMRAAEMVWVPVTAPGGVCAALEAMAVGRPVIASNLPPLAEVVRDGETGLLVSPGDKAALGRATRGLLDDPVRRDALGDAGQAWVRKAFTPRAMTEGYLGLYRAAPAGP